MFLVANNTVDLSSVSCSFVSYPSSDDMDQHGVFLAWCRANQPPALPQPPSNQAIYSITFPHMERTVEKALHALACEHGKEGPKRKSSVPVVRASA